MKSTRFGEILLLEYPSNMEMNLSTFRISEFFEGDLKGKKFTTDQFIEEWSDENGNMDILEYGGKFYSYFSYWDGINFTKKVLDKFAAKFESDLSVREKEIIRAARKSSYIIALAENGAQSTDPAYENEEIHAYLVGYDQKEYESFFPLILPEEVAPYVASIGEIYAEKESSIIINTTI